MENNRQNPTAEKLKQFLVPLATLGVIAFNWLAAKGYVNNVTPEIISDRYPTFITPAGYAFAIWSLIYLGLIVFSVYQALPSQTANPRFLKIRSIYILNCAANCFWIYLWHHDAVALSLSLMLVLLATLAYINKVLQSAGGAESWLARVPFGIYFGWVTVATILNATIALVALGIDLSRSATNVAAAFLLIFAALLGVVIRLKMKSAAYALTVAWALTAIAVKQSGATVIVAGCAAGVIALLIAAIYPITQIKNSEQ